MQPVWRVETNLPGGDGLVRVDGEVVLVRGAVEGDRLRLQLGARQRGVRRGRIVELVEASPMRVTPPCPVADRCGGCALQAVAIEAQAAMKSRWVRDAFGSLMDAGSKWLPMVSADAPRLRRRLRWFVGHDAAGYFLGFYAAGTHQPVRHGHCAVVEPALNQLRAWLEAAFDLQGVQSVQALLLDDGAHLVIEGDDAPPQLATRPDCVDGAVNIFWRDRAGVTRPLRQAAQQSVHQPMQSLHDRLPAGSREIALLVGPDDFVQGQREGNRELIAQIQAWAGDVRRVADLFCGIGNLSLPLAVATGAEVAGAELNGASVRAAMRSAGVLGVQAAFVQANLFESFDMAPYVGADLLILDPPRRGAKRIAASMGRLLPAKVVLISCDVAAGARDGAALQRQGYRLAALRALDLFPFAGHVEAMSLWERA